MLLLLSHGANITHEAEITAGRLNRVCVIRAFMKRKSDCVSSRYLGACIGGNLNIIKTGIKGRIFEIEYMGKAAEHGHTHIIKYILNQPITLSNYYGICRLGQADLILQALAKNTIIKEKDLVRYGLLLTCESGNIESVNIFINSTDNWNRALPRACKSGNIELVKLLILKGADKWDKGLKYAIKYGHNDVAQMMLDNGANDYKSALNAACKYHNISMMRLLLEKYKGDLTGIMITACDNNNMEAALLFIDHVEISWIMISYACNYRNMRLIKLLFDKVTDLSPVNLGSILYSACYSGDRNIVDFVISKGANDWNRGLSGACDGGYVYLAQMMIKRGANNLYSVFAAIISTKKINIIKLFDRCDISDLNKALTIACEKRAYYNIKKIIRAGATACYNEKCDGHEF